MAESCVGKLRGFGIKPQAARADEYRFAAAEMRPNDVNEPRLHPEEELRGSKRVFRQTQALGDIVAASRRKEAQNHVRTQRRFH